MSAHDQMLPYVRKPSRYLGKEVNAVNKDLSRADVKVALAFPDLYEIGMSHLGLKILYHILNSCQGVAAERVFTPGEDYIALLEERGLPLCSLESQLPLRHFDIVGFTLQYELSYSNILLMLRLSGIPVQREDRGEEDPFVIAGGPCAYNPEPLADFFDAFVLGDGEEVTLQIVEAYREHRRVGGRRDEFLLRLAGLEGVYVPSLFHIRYRDNGGIKEICPLLKSCSNVTRRLVRDFENAPHPTSPVVPFMEIVHDRLNIEVSRGCTRGCRFCQAGCTYRPVRERSAHKVKELVHRSLERSGYEEVSLTSLSIGDYSGLSCLVPELMAEFSKDCTSLSLPSLRPGTLEAPLMKEISRVRKTGFTLALEAGTRRLRRVINKDMADDVIMENLMAILKAGWGSLKLYFMIGLPTEREEDLRAIVELCHRIIKLQTNEGKYYRNLNVALSSFVPKAHTPFQWLGIEALQTLKEKQSYLKRKLRSSKFSLKWHQPEMSYLEAIFARGDRRLGKVLLRAMELGCRFDGWGDKLRFTDWMRAFDEVGLDPNYYAHCLYDLDKPLPWDHLHTGMEKAFLRRELERSLRGEVTPDCLLGSCEGCGINAGDIECPRREGAAFVTKERTTTPVGPDQKDRGATYKYRVKYSKGPEVRFLSHLEIINAIFRACRRAKLPLEYSKGHHPHPRMSFGPALPVGMESLGEQMDISIRSFLEPSELKERMNAELPAGLRVFWVSRLSFKSTPLPQVPSRVKYSIYLERKALNFPEEKSHRRHIDKYLEGHAIGELRVERGVSKQSDIKPFIETINLEQLEHHGCRLDITIDQSGEKAIRPWDLLKDLYNLTEEEARAIRVVKTDAQLSEKGEYALRNRD